MSVLEKQYVIEMENGEKWSIPVKAIAEDRAKYYAERDYYGDVSVSLKMDTLPLFEDDSIEIEDWAKNNMDWEGVSGSATLIERSNMDYQEQWMSGDVDIL